MFNAIDARCATGRHRQQLFGIQPGIEIRNRLQCQRLTRMRDDTTVTTDQKRKTAWCRGDVSHIAHHIIKLHVGRQHAL